jgi:hypothetical protein
MYNTEEIANAKTTMAIFLVAWHTLFGGLEL